MASEKSGPVYDGGACGRHGNTRSYHFKGVPGKTKVGAIYGLFFPIDRIREAVDAAKQTQISLNVLNIDTAGGPRYFRTNFAYLIEYMDVYWELHNPRIMEKTDLIYECYRYAKKNGKPVITFHDDLVGSGDMEAKGLMSISDDLDVVGRQAGKMAKKIFAGASPGGIPRETAASGVITVNLLEAKYFKLNIPPEIAPKGWKIKYITPKIWHKKPPR